MNEKHGAYLESLRTLITKMNYSRLSEKHEQICDLNMYILHLLDRYTYS